MFLCLSLSYFPAIGVFCATVGLHLRKNFPYPAVPPCPSVCRRLLSATMKVPAMHLIILSLSRHSIRFAATPSGVLDASNSASEKTGSKETKNKAKTKTPAKDSKTAKGKGTQGKTDGNKQLPCCRDSLLVVVVMTMFLTNVSGRRRPWTRTTRRSSDGIHSGPLAPFRS